MKLKTVLMASALATVAACSGGSPPPATEGAGGAARASGGRTQINGAGATFPYPIYSKWFSEYNKLHPNVEINYQSLGSGAGIRQLSSRTVFFGASDQPMKDDQLQAAPGKILHFPTVLGAVVPIYNLPEVSQQLKFTGPLIADIVLGKVKKWNDPAIAKLNPGVKLPPTDLTLVHRSDGSGTTFIFADYLGKVSDEFKKTVGVDASLKWPVGVGGKGNEGVSGLVQQTPGSVGYVELVYALQNKITVGAVQNSAGTFVVPSVASVTAAAAGAAANMPPDFRVSITNAPGADAYPIASFTWMLLYEDPQDKAQAAMMKEFLRWALSDGQKMAPELGYASLPPQVVEMEMKALEQLKVQ
ncbi:MAG TPA: phosphate ABC transporter substrate-binding protein PstS [Vicinamibacterales bacterium]|nr:phosphate ABC transporter substrate-binding protein PstS [Vicinamibacterales bacterium]